MNKKSMEELVKNWEQRLVEKGYDLKTTLLQCPRCNGTVGINEGRCPCVPLAKPIIDIDNAPKVSPFNAEICKEEDGSYSSDIYYFYRCVNCDQVIGSFDKIIYCDDWNGCGQVMIRDLAD